MTSTVAGLPAPQDLSAVSPRAVYLLPRGVVHGAHAEQLISTGAAFRLCKDASAYTSVEIVVRDSESISRYVAPVTAFDPWHRVLAGPLKEYFQRTIETIKAPRSPMAGLDLSGPKVMGVVNVTPDSFSDGGDHATPDAAIDHGFRLADAGAHILDVGGESTRPGADPVDPEEEHRRVLPVVRELSEKGLLVSIDTRHASTMNAAIDAGAAIVNDVTALTGDPDSLNTVTRRQVPAILMHMQGDPQTMQSNPQYTWAPVDVFDHLSRQVERCVAAGMDKAHICVDPGIGFGKTDDHNLALLDSIALLHGLGCPILLGASRKSFIGRISDTKEPKERLGGSLAAALSAARQGVQILRVHDVKETSQALTIAQSIDQHSD